jgi:hypothetical protein
MEFLRQNLHFLQVNNKQLKVKLNFNMFVPIYLFFFPSVLINFFDRLQQGEDPEVFHQLTGKNRLTQQKSSSDIPIPSATSSSLIAPRKASFVTAENVETLLRSWLSNKLSQPIENLTISKRSTSTYPFQLQVSCFKCQVFRTLIRVGKERVRNREFTRFRAQSYILHVQKCNT